MSTQSLTTNVSALPRASRAPFSRVLSMLAVRRERRALNSLDVSRLEDLGITRDAARREASKPIWDLPVRPF
ncbi:Uncharacterized conserved protein YjiS, DUF1127 family [Pseudooceanicola antarcticus]|uniref:Uncharacterized conserved protein YjiS, DUF1127 family n=1 Tax=Pseudooceanicola antarcticus TaxID=1247613 RepID=A0A285IGT0_9RHOB|nr:hypothetical protein [Pseudooceanicola antarcticus]PJE29022.1 hypothetical protein CVM39_11280 [Pseudooceanicola antarcticus]SNY47169.1 Uncharacterized conserved protein YjiS, DUF1127 family [Pseudooceanicola antarcticus]